MKSTTPVIWVSQRGNGLFYARMPFEPESSAVSGRSLVGAAQNLVWSRPEDFTFGDRKELEFEIVVETPLIKLKLFF